MATFQAPNGLLGTRTRWAPLGALPHRLSHRASAARGRRAGTSPLMAAARRGDADTVARLLRDGADPGVRNAWGRSALHDAVDRGDADVAACLLAYGAPHDVRDRWGHAPLASGCVPLETLHAIRQRYHRLPRPGGAATAVPTHVAQWIGALERDGIVRVSGLVPPDALQRMQDGMDRFVARLEARVARGEAVYRHYDEEEHWWAAHRAWVGNNAFRDSADLVRLAAHADVLAAAERYVGRPVFVQRAVAMRYLPAPPVDEEMFRWHHDMEEKRCKMMVLLTDVGPDGQHMSYVLGSHRLFHPLSMFFENACSLDYCRRRLGEVRIFDAVGRAGDVFFFDSNGAHRGRRRADAPPRDVFLIELSGDGSDVWGGDVRAELLDGSPRALDAFGPLLAVRKKWDRPRVRRNPTWVENLPRVDTWLAPERPDVR